MNGKRAFPGHRTLNSATSMMSEILAVQSEQGCTQLTGMTPPINCDNRDLLGDFRTRMGLQSSCDGRDIHHLEVGRIKKQDLVQAACAERAQDWQPKNRPVFIKFKSCSRCGTNTIRNALDPVNGSLALETFSFMFQTRSQCKIFTV